MQFTTRPELQGNFGVVSSTHWLASAAAMKILEKGGNAFDAAAAAGFVLQVVEPHLVGTGGDMTLLFYDKNKDKTLVLCGQGVAPYKATIKYFKNIGLDRIPGNGLLPATVPGAVGAWFTLCRDYGRLNLRDVLEPAIHYAQHGFPMLERIAFAIAGVAPFFKEHWSSSFEQWVPNGDFPQAGSWFCLPNLARTFTKILQEGEKKSGREEQFEEAFNVFYNGFVAEKIVEFFETQKIIDSSGKCNGGLLSLKDFQDWKPTYEEPVTKNYHGWKFYKANTWAQSPVLLQCLSLLKEVDFTNIEFDSADFVHVVVEAMKLAFADREIFYGDPKFVSVPLKQLLSESYNIERRKLLKSNASIEFQPGVIEGFKEQRQSTLELLKSFGTTENAIYEPTMQHLSEQSGDTVHIDVIDQWGNMVSATPSGGWLQSSPTIPELGFCLNTRAQMFVLEPGLANSLQPQKRPRTTLSPTLAYHRENDQRLALGTPGGDQQDQWQLVMLLRYIHYDLNLQQAIEAPLFHSNHIPSSFYPRQSQPNQIMIEGNFSTEQFNQLLRKGHKIERGPKWSIGRLTAVMRDKDGILYAGANPRGMQAYAIGR